MIGTRAAAAAAWLAFGAGVAPTFAAPATPEEAQRLAALFALYVGGPAAPGQAAPVSVVPHGEGYTASLDLTRMLAFTQAGGTTVTAGALVAELTPQADGLWHVVVDGLPPVGIVQGPSTTSLAFQGIKVDGLFDPALHGFRTATTASAGTTARSRGPNPADIAFTQDAHGTLTTTAGTTPGKATIASQTAATALGYTVSPAPTSDATPAEPPALQARVDRLESSSNLGDLSLDALDALWRFTVAHPSREALTAAQDEFKSKLRAALPIASTFSGSSSLSKLSVSTALGTVTADQASERVEAGTPGAAGGMLVSVGVSGLGLPDGLVPPWAVPLVPTSVSFTQSLGPLNLTAALGRTIDRLDLSAPAPVEADEKEQVAEALGLDKATVTIAPSTITTPTLALKLQGEVHLTKPLPTGSATVSATGLDKAVDAVRAAAGTDPTATQVLTVMLAAKALAKADGPDSYAWAIAAAPGGDVTVNGTSLSGLAGAGSGPPPAAKVPGHKTRKPAAP